MKVRLLTVLIMLCFQFSSAQSTSVLVVAGGHSFDTVSFFNLLEKIPGIGYDFMLQPEANRFLTEHEDNSYDLLLFYDMWQPIEDAEKQAFIKLTESGKPMLFLHHALVSYQLWPEFEKIIGGRYVEPLKNDPRGTLEKSTYRHDVWIDITVADKTHPVTLGMNNFRIFDEVYGNFRVGKQVKPLLKTNHPESTEIIAWENKYNNSRIIYIQPGHNHHAYENEYYLKLITQAINYLSEK
jgi:uncharacterized protein